MAILDIVEYRYGWSSTDTSVVRKYLVTTDGNSTGFEVCRPGITSYTPSTPISVTLPKLFDFLYTEEYGRTTFRVLPGGISASRIDDKTTQWIVTVTWTQTSMQLEDISSFTIGSRQYKQVADAAFYYKRPLQSEEDFVGEDASFTEEPFYPFVNTAGELYDPADTIVEYSSTILSFVKREDDDFDYVSTLKKRGSINQLPVTVFGFELDRHQGRVLSINPEVNIDEDGEIRWFTRYELEIMPDGMNHNLKLQDQGYMALFDGAADPREINVSDITTQVKKTDKTNKPVTKPQLLDGEGKLLAAGDDPKFWEYRIYQHYDWATAFSFPSVSVDVGEGGTFEDGQI